MSLTDVGVDVGVLVGVLVGVDVGFYERKSSNAASESYRNHTSTNQQLRMLYKSLCSTSLTFVGDEVGELVGGEVSDVGELVGVVVGESVTPVLQTLVCATI